MAEALLERDRELSELHAALTRADAGEGRLLLIEGSAGVGKTALAERFRAEAARGSRHVLAGRGTPMERPFAFGVVEQVLAPALRRATVEQRAQWLSGAAAIAGPAVGGLLAEPGQSHTTESILHGLYWLVSAMSADRTLVAIVDDVQWADVETLRFLVHLTPRLTDLPVLVVVIRRSGEPGTDPALLDALAEAAQVISPAPLSLLSVRRAIGERLGLPQLEFARSCHEATGGNPLLLRLALFALQQAGVAPRDENAAEVRRLGGARAADAVRRRLGGLGPEAERCAVAVAVLGAYAHSTNVATLAALDVGEARAALDRLREADVLDPGPEPRFVHPVVEEAVLGDVGPGALAQLHERAAECLLAAAAPPTDVALHLLRTEPAGDPRRAAALRAAARAAIERGAPAAAVPLLERALAELGASEQGERGALLLELGTAELQARSGTPVVHLREALAVATSLDDRFAAAAQLTTADIWHMDFSLGVSDVDAVIEECEAAGRLDLARPLAIRLAAKGSYGFFNREGLERLRGRFADDEELDPDDPDDQLYAGLLANLATVENRPAAECVELADIATRGTALLDRSELGDPALLLALNILVGADARELAIPRLTRAIERARERNVGLLFAAACGMRSYAHWRAGDLHAAEADGRFAVTATSFDGLAIPSCAAWLAWTLTDRGTLEEADAVLREAGLLDELPLTLLHNAALAARWALKLARHDPQGALDDALELGRRQIERGAERNIILPWRAWAAEAHAVLGDQRAALELADEALALADEWGTPRARGTALRARGLGLGGDEGVAALTEAVDCFDAAGARLEEARALVDLGSLLRRSGQRSAAREQLRAGLAVAERCGADRLAERAREELASSGAKLRREAATGAAALTASERRVCEYAARGLTNPEIAQALFVSRKTVEAHLGSAYRKLDVTSRDQLAALMAAPASAA